MAANTVTDSSANKARKLIQVTETPIKSNLATSVLNDKSHAVQTLPVINDSSCHSKNFGDKTKPTIDYYWKTHTLN